MVRKQLLCYRIVKENVLNLLILLILSVVFIVISTTRLKMHPFLSLIVAALLFGVFSGMPPIEVIDAINKGFGSVIGYIGIVIIAGSIIGIFLEKSGGARRLAESTLKVTGPKHAPLGMTFIGYIISMPVFCDSGFILLSSLNKAIAKRTKQSVAIGAVALSLGLYATHTMVPPTPGPVAAAGMLGADLGLVILCGIPISALAALAGWIFAITIAARVDIQPPEEDGAEEEVTITNGDHGPSTLKSLLPIFLPVMLIVMRAIVELPAKPIGEGNLAQCLVFLGQPVIALLIGVFCAFLLPKRLDRDMWSTTGWVGQAIVAAAAIIVTTGAGGAFGQVLRDSGIADVLSKYLEGSNGLGIWLPFLIAATIKTAQGSSTVAIITTAGIMLPLLEVVGLDSDAAKALVVVAIGAGSMVVSHANDSYFWVVTQFSGMSVNQGYRLQSMGTLIQGLVAAVALWIVSWVVL